MPKAVLYDEMSAGEDRDRVGGPIGALAYHQPLVPGTARYVVVRISGAPGDLSGSNRNFVPAVPVAWAGNVFLRLQQLRSYPRNWDSYGGKALTTAAYLSANSLLGRLMFESIPQPSIVPTGRGGVQFEWHRKGSHVEVYFSPDGNSEVSFEDDFGGEWEGPLDELAYRLVAVLKNL
jgi:hypothetical protein